MYQDVEREKPIAFFDSGAGGLTVLALAARRQPAEKFREFGYTANAPQCSNRKEEVRPKHAGGKVPGRNGK